MYELDSLFVVDCAVQWVLMFLDYKTTYLGQYLDC